MTTLQFIEAALKDSIEFEQGKPVTIQIDPLVLSNGLSISLKIDSLDVVIPGGQSYDTPIQAAHVTLPLLGAAVITAGENSVVIQKA